MSNRHGAGRAHLRPQGSRVVAFAAFCLAVGGLISSGAVAAAQAGADAPLTRHFPTAQIFTFLFLMLGPFKIIGPFAKITARADAAYTHRVALLATLFSSVALLAAALLGENILSSYGIPLPVMALAGGLILFLVALINILQQFVPAADHADAAAAQGTTPALKQALSPLAFPVIVTPYGIATLVVFLALSPDLHTRWVIGAIVLAIMLLNLVAMILTRHIMPVLGLLLPILGAVLGVVQVALGLQIIHSSLKAMGLA